MQDKPGSQEFSRPSQGLPLSRAAYRRLALTEEFFAAGGGIVLPDPAAARRLAARLRGERGPRDDATPGRLFALGLIHELLIALVDRYRHQLAAPLTDQALTWIEKKLGRDRLDATLASFALLYPPLPVLRAEVTIEEYLAGSTRGVAHRELLLDALLLLHLANENPAFGPFKELFDDTELLLASDYRAVIDELEHFFLTLPPVDAAVVSGGEEESGDAPRSLLEHLRQPLSEAGDSLSAQLALLRPVALEAPAPSLDRVLRGVDLLREEERPIFPPGPGPVEVIRFPADGSPRPATHETTGPERFTLDRDWMPQLVLVAKNAFVWLHQLSDRFERPIARLDEIPDEALDELARQGFTGLWLIGVWQRSRASRRIKRLCGNPQAAASAYSLDGYRIAEEVGGEEALAILTERAAARGIRLASDMVPNHMGIDSRWVIDHPERFLSLAEPPFADYRFTGPDLSSDPQVTLRIEDHYYDKSDAAVVFQRLDHASGEVRYLYHGNDGTSTPWNDTAQLDYLKNEVREAVMETILDVARRFPVIRFDAAMTLARRHIQRLWFPPPGQGGAIPSRSGHGLSQEEFDRLMPTEFWRQVVDRMAEEAPDTLLLAEAFWLMESYFVRSLGMHRVYNSAFMHMLRDERNADYRQSLANVLEFDPRILERYVNFMSNPDERTAREQFGTGAKYFGVCTLMATLPGLPMFGHGQLEGLTERYGMEYQQPYHDEQPDAWLLDQHQRRIAPLLRRRALFAGAENFRLYDFELDEVRTGAKTRIDPNVFVYSNRTGGETEPDRTGATDSQSNDAEAAGTAPANNVASATDESWALIVFHNHDSTTRGRIRHSLPFAVQRQGDKQLEQTTLDQELKLSAALDAPPSGQWLLACHDQASGLEHLFDPRILARDGLVLELGPYQCHAFLDLRPVEASEPWRELAAALAGRGVPSLEEALLEIELLPVLDPFLRLLDPALLMRLVGERSATARDEIEHRAHLFFTALLSHREGECATLPASADQLRTKFRQDLDRIAALLERLRGADDPQAATRETVESYLAEGWNDNSTFWVTLISWLAARQLTVREGEAEEGEMPGNDRTTDSWVDRLLLDHQITATLKSYGVDEDLAIEARLLFRLLAQDLARLPPLGTASEPLATWLHQPAIAAYLRLHSWEGVEYLHRESLETLCWWIVLAAAGFATGEPGVETAPVLDSARRLLARAEEAGYRLDLMLEEAAAKRDSATS